MDQENLQFIGLIGLFNNWVGRSSYLTGIRKPSSSSAVGLLTPLFCTFSLPSYLTGIRKPLSLSALSLLTACFLSAFGLADFRMLGFFLLWLIKNPLIHQFQKSQASQSPFSHKRQISYIVYGNNKTTYINHSFV